MPTSCDRVLNIIWIFWFHISAFLWWRVSTLQVTIVETLRWSLAPLASSPHVTTGGDHRLRQKALRIARTYELHRAWSTVEISNDPMIQISSRSCISRFLWWRVLMLQVASVETPRWSLTPLAPSSIFRRCNHWLWPQPYSKTHFTLSHLGYSVMSPLDSPCHELRNRAWLL